jgi:hypothetical protein
VLYTITSLMLTLVLGTRLQHGHPSPGFTITRTYLGPQLPAFNYVTASIVMVGAAALPVLLLAVRPALWARHRGKLAVANRMLRLCVQCSTFLTPGAVRQLSAIVVGRVVRLQNSAPTNAAAALVMHPMLLYVQVRQLMHTQSLRSSVGGGHRSRGDIHMCWHPSAPPPLFICPLLRCHPTACSRRQQCCPGSSRACCRAAPLPS